MENSLKKSTEEMDLIERSSKKVKIRKGELGLVDLNPQQEKVIENEPKQKISY